MQFLAYLAVLVIGSLVAYALAPKPPKSKPPTLEDFDLPTAEEGRSIPWIFGTYKITDPNIIWYGDLEVRTKTKDKVKTRIYRMGIQLELCISPVDALVALEYGGKDLGIAEVTSSQQIFIDHYNLFGGRDREGGIEGYFDICFGEPTQAVNDYLAAQIGTPLSAYRDSLTIVGRKPNLVANSTYIKPLLPTVRNIEAGWADGACWYVETAAVSDISTWTSEYDALVETINDGAGLDYRWKLDSAFAADGDTEESVGNAGSLLIRRSAAQYFGFNTVIGDDHGVTCATSDGRSVYFTQYAESVGGFLGVNYFLDGTEPFSLGVWIESEIGQAYDVFGTNVDSPNSWYQGIWVTVLADGSLYLQKGDGLGNVHTHRLSYTSAAGLIDPIGRHFFVLQWDPLGVGFDNQIKLYCDGARVELTYSSGSASDFAWDSTGTSPTIGFGCNWVPIGENKMQGWMDEAFLHLGIISADDIAEMWHKGTCSGSGSWDMNPAHIIYKVLTDTDQGLAEPSATIDDTNFRAAALTFYTEGMGLSTQWRNEGSIRGFIAEVCTHAGAVLSLDPQTGLTQLIPLRDDYDAGALELLSDDEVVEVVEWQDAADGEAVNEVTVEFRERDGRTGSVTWSNRASIQQLGRIHQTLSFPMISRRDLALRVAKRECLQRSSNLARGKIKVNRLGWDKLPGAVFRFAHTGEGIDELVVRVIDIDVGTLTDGAITINVVQDIFSLSDTLTDVGEQDSGWTAPDTAPAAASTQDVIEAPYWALAGSMGEANAAALSTGAGYLVSLAVKSSGVAEGYNRWTRVSPVDYAETGEDVDFAPSATLVAALDRQTDSSIVLTGGSDLDLVEPGWIAMIGTGTTAEFCYVQSLNTTTNEASLLRGRLDTTPQAHAAGTRVWFLDGDAPDWPRDPTQWTDGDAVNVKLQPITGGGVLPLASASAMTATLDARQVRPYPPGNIEINADYWPVDLEGVLTITWAHRDRLVQGYTHVSQYDATDYGPEAGTTYNVYAYDDADNTLLDSDTGISGTSWSPTITVSCTLRIEIESVRDGYTSWQRQVRTFDYFATSALLTEASDYLLTEAGEYTVTET